MPPTMKRLLIRVSGSTRPPFKIQIRLGTTCQDILDHLELRGYVLAPASEPLHQFLPEMDMFRHVRGVRRLISMTLREAVERFVEDVVFGSGDL